MRQLIIAEDLLAQIRSANRAFGTLLCSTVGTVGLGRKLAGSMGEDSSPHMYDELLLEDQAEAGGAEERLSFVLAEPPLDSDPIILKPELPLGTQRAAQEGPSVEQPFLKTLFENHDQLLIVGSSASELIYAQSWPAAQSQVWRRGTVSVIPIRPSSEGLDPNLTGKQIGIVGLGSIGSYVAKFLAMAGVTEFVFLDPDRLEVKNLRRHLCGQRAIGSLKVDAVAAAIQQSGFDISATRFSCSVPRDDTPTIRRALGHCDALVCCADSSAAQQHVNSLGVTLGVPSVAASIKLLPEPLGEIVTTRAGKPGCLNCWRIKMEDQGLMMRGEGIDQRDYPGPTEATPVGMPGYHLAQVAALACDMVSRAMVETEPSVWLSPLQTSVSGFYDLNVQASEVSAIEPMAKCLVCGNQ